MKRPLAAIALALLLSPMAWSLPISPQAIFLLDASISSDEAALANRIAQLKKILETDTNIKKFNVLVFDVAGRWLEPKEFLTNDAQGRERAIQRLKDVAPEGACNLAAALERLTVPLFGLEPGAPLRVFLISDAFIYLGESAPYRLVASLHSRCPYSVRFTCLAKNEISGNLDLLTALKAPPPKEKPVFSRREAFDKYIDLANKRAKLLDGKNGEHVKLLLKALSDKDLELPAAPTEDKLPSADRAYLDARAKNLYSTDIYLAEAKRRRAAKDTSGQVRVLTSLLPLHPSNADVGRSVGYRLLDAQQNVLAAHLFERIQQRREDDPHSYRDLARAYGDAGMFGLAAIQYEIVLAGIWNNKYAASLKEVAQEEYAHMMRDAIRRKVISNKLIDVFGERLEAFDSKKLQADLRVTISWNTDETDVDLWVIEPGGEKCFYGHQKTSNGGELTQDIVNGYGPERYQMIKARPGEYAIAVHFFSGPRNAQVVEGTHVNVVVRRNAGTPQEESQRFTVIVRQRNDLVEVVRMKF